MYVIKEKWTFWKKKKFQQIIQIFLSKQVSTIIPDPDTTWPRSHGSNRIDSTGQNKYFGKKTSDLVDFSGYLWPVMAATMGNLQP